MYNFTVFMPAHYTLWHHMKNKLHLFCFPPVNILWPRSLGRKLSLLTLNTIMRPGGKS